MKHVATHNGAAARFQGAAMAKAMAPARANAATSTPARAEALTPVPTGPLTPAPARIGRLSASVRGGRNPSAFPTTLLLAALLFGALGFGLGPGVGTAWAQDGGGAAGFVSEFPLSVEPVPYDLNRVVERALSHHLGVRVSRLQSAVAERQAIQQRAALRPSLSVTATPNWFETPVPDFDALDLGIDSDKLRDLIEDVDWSNCDANSCPGLDDLLDEFSDQMTSVAEQLEEGIPQKLQSGRGMGVTLNGAVPLWRSPLQRAVADAADWQQARAEVGVDEAAAGAILQSIDAYFAVVRAEAALHIAELTLAEADLRLEEVTDRVRAGTATTIDRLQTEAERHGAEAQLLQARGEVTAARMMLNSVLGFDLNVPLHVAPPGSAAGSFGTDVEVGDALRLASRTVEVRQARADVGLAEAGAVISEEQAKPSLRVFGTYKWPDVELTIGVDRHGYLGGSAAWSETRLDDERVTNDDPASWFAGFELTWNIFDGGKQRAEVEAARLQAEQARVYHEHVEQTARAEVLSAYVRWQAAAEAVEGVARGVEAAGQGVEVARRLAESGAATRSAVLRAEIGLARAQQGYVDALYGAAMAHSAYLHAAGELVPHWQRVLAARP